MFFLCYFPQNTKKTQNKHKKNMSQFCPWESSMPNNMKLARVSRDRHGLQHEAAASPSRGRLPGCLAGVGGGRLAGRLAGWVTGWLAVIWRQLATGLAGWLAGRLGRECTRGTWMRMHMELQHLHACYGINHAGCTAGMYCQRCSNNGLMAMVLEGIVLKASPL